MAFLFQQIIEKSPEVVVGVLSTIIAALVAVLVRRGTYKPLVCRIKAKRLKTKSGNGVGVLVCEFQGDTHGRLSKIVRGNIATNYPADPSAKTAPINVISFPLGLAAVGDDDESDRRNEATARRWLEKSGCDVIVWGERLDDANLSIIKVLGKNTPAAHIQELRLNVSAGSFNAVVADAVTREVVEAQSKAFALPNALTLDYLRLIAERASLLVRSDLAGFTNDTAKAIRFSLNNLLTEICLRSSRVSDWDDALTNAEKLVALCSETQETRAWSHAVSSFASHFRRRAWAGMELSQIRCGLLSIERAELRLREWPEYSGIAERLAVEAEFVKAIYNRDTDQDDMRVDTSILFKILQVSKLPETRRLCVAFLASFKPLDLLAGEGISEIKVGFLRRSWARLKCDDLPPDLRSSVFESLIEEQVRIASTSIDIDLYADAMIWILEQEPSGDDLLRLFWAIAFADTGSLIVRRFGLSFFKERFPTLDFMAKLTRVSGELFGAAAAYTQASYLQTYFLGKAGAASAGLGSSTGASMHFSMADNAYSRQEALIRLRSPKRLQQVVFERCSSLNTWSLRAADQSKADLSLALLSSVDAASAAFGCYLLAFAHMSRAYITVHNAAENPTDLQRQYALSEVRVALTFCKKASSLPNENGKQGTEAVNQVRKGANEFLARWAKQSKGAS